MRRNDNEMRRECLLCNEEIEDIESANSVELENGQSYSAHKDCIAALQKLMNQKIELPPRENMSSKDLILRFYMDGWFSTPRSLSDLQQELRQSGFNYDSTTISHNLRHLTQRGILSRRGKRRNYEYIQKRPP